MLLMDLRDTRDELSRVLVKEKVRTHQLDYKRQRETYCLEIGFTLVEVAFFKRELLLAGLAKECKVFLLVVRGSV